MKVSIRHLWATIVITALAHADSTKLPVSESFLYQGTLRELGVLVDGSYDFNVHLYDALFGGTYIAGTELLAVEVVDGQFLLEIDFGPDIFVGEARWLEIRVKQAGGESYTVLSPRQPLSPTPYSITALNVIQPLIISEDVATGPDPAQPTAAIQGINTHVAQSGSDITHGVFGESNSAGVYTSPYAISAGVFGRAGALGNQVGVHGEAGNVSNVSGPLGTVGVVGRGSSRGVYGGSENGSGVYGNALGNYGVWGQSDTYRGVTGRTNRVDNNYGFYTPDNLYSLNYTKMGAMTQVVKNGGDVQLSAGEVVVFSGIELSNRANTPIVEVSQATASSDPAVAGVVLSRFDVSAVLDGDTDEEVQVAAKRNPTPEGSVAPGEYLLIVVQGPVQVRVDTTAGAIRPGDALATHATGSAASAEGLSLAMKNPSRPGAIFAKALEPARAGSQLIYAYVALH